MAARILVLYNHPAKPTAFDAYYSHTHAPLTKAIPGLRSFQISDGPIAAGDGAESAYHLIAALDFDSMDSIGQAMQSPEGAAAVADLANFAQAGVTVALCEMKDA